MNIINALNELTGNYNQETSQAKRLRVKAGMQPTVFVPVSTVLGSWDFPDYEATLVAKALYEHSVAVNATDLADYIAKSKVVETEGKLTFSANWLSELKANPAQVWESFQLPDLTKISKTHLAEAKLVIFKEACSGMLTQGPEKAQALVAIIGTIDAELAKNRK